MRLLYICKVRCRRQILWSVSGHCRTLARLVASSHDSVLTSDNADCAFQCTRNVYQPYRRCLRDLETLRRLLKTGQMLESNYTMLISRVIIVFKVSKKKIYPRGIFYCHTKEKKNYNFDRQLARSILCCVLFYISTYLNLSYHMFKVLTFK